jgi:hypothetical protein
MSDGVLAFAPVSLEGPLSFLGHEMTQEKDVITLLTYWQVTERSGQPFSLMGHLVGPDGVPLAVGDGLGVSWDQLQPGDVLVQRHTLPVEQGLSDGPYWLQTGAYWLGTLERWPVVVNDRAAGDRILLAAYSP